MTREEHLAAIKAADAAYYNNDAPVMTDSEYDSLRADYIEKYGAADLDYVPGEAAAAFSKFRHTVPVISLAKVKFDEERGKLETELRRLWPVLHEPKLDGLTVVAYPKADGSCTFVTRGDGKTGEVLPAFIKAYEKSGVNRTGEAVRGEVFMDVATFSAINAEREAAGEELFRNPRNAAAGILRNKERSVYLDRLRYMVYDIPTLDVAEPEKLAMLREKTAFEVAQVGQAESVEAEIAAIEKFYEEHLHGGVPIDGVVVKNAEAGSLARFGGTNHHNSNAVAVKFRPDQAKTALREIVWQVGRDSLTPVAVFDEVELDGTTVSKASLHNWANVRRLALHPGDAVLVEKANEIIPQVIQNFGQETPPAPFARPTVCPACGAALASRRLETSIPDIPEDEQIELYCPNNACAEKLAQAVAYLGSRRLLAIDGLSVMTARKLTGATGETEAKIAAPWDIFRLTVEDFRALPGFAEKSASSLYDAVQRAKNSCDLAHFVAACCVPGVGLTVGGALMRRYHTADALLSALTDETKKDELTAIDGIGETLAAILQGETFTNAFRALREHITPTVYEPPVAQDGAKPKGKSLTFVITGKLSRPRDEIKAELEAKGHKVTGSVSKNTDYLLCESKDSQSTKAKKARELGTQVIGETELAGILENA
ncbi:MAG: NAD-dependent DNA ligase LigA [Schwartzia sp.]|nr:NAD-dependent DNA ligase LigA [Schwartzia sp. (in: firmicutes)]